MGIAEIVDVDGHAVGEQDPLDEMLHGQDVFAANVQRLFVAWGRLLKDVGVRRPKTSAVADLRASILADMKAYNVWRQDVLELPRGGAGPETRERYRYWARRYDAKRRAVKSAVGTTAPRAVDVTSMKAPGGFLGDLKDAAFMVLIFGVGAWLLFGRK